MNRLKRFFLGIQIVAFAASVPLLLRLPFRVLESRLQPASPYNFDAAEADRILLIWESVFPWMRRFTSRPCLVRGVTLFYFLRRAGMDVSLVFGVGAVNGQHAAHCWLSIASKPFLEATDPLAHFLPMYAFNSEVMGAGRPDQPLDQGHTSAAR